MNKISHPFLMQCSISGQIEIAIMRLVDIVGVFSSLVRVHIIKVLKQYPIEDEKVSPSLLSAVQATLGGLLIPAGITV